MLILLHLSTYTKQHREETLLDFLWCMRSTDRYVTKADKQQVATPIPLTYTHVQKYTQENVLLVYTGWMAHIMTWFEIKLNSELEVQTYDLRGFFLFLAGLFWLWSSNSTMLSFSFSLLDWSKEAAFVGGFPILLEDLKGSIESSNESVSKL